MITNIYYLLFLIITIAIITIVTTTYTNASDKCCGFSKDCYLPDSCLIFIFFIEV